MKILLLVALFLGCSFDPDALDRAFHCDAQYLAAYRIPAEADTCWVATPPPDRMISINNEACPGEPGQSRLVHGGDTVHGWANLLATDADGQTIKQVQCP